MITEDYVSLETAKLLKEKGFDYYPDGSYWLIDANNVMYWVSEIGAYDYVDNPTESFQRPKNGYRLVTQAMAMKWLREVYDCVICITPLTFYCGEIVSKWGYCIWADDNTVVDEESSPRLESYEEAGEAAIKYCLENLI